MGEIPWSLQDRWTCDLATMNNEKKKKDYGQLQVSQITPVPNIGNQPSKPIGQEDLLEVGSQVTNEETRRSDENFHAAIYPGPRRILNQYCENDPSRFHLPTDTSTCLPTAHQSPRPNQQEINESRHCNWLPNLPHTYTYWEHYTPAFPIPLSVRLPSTITQEGRNSMHFPHYAFRNQSPPLRFQSAYQYACPFQSAWTSRNYEPFNTTLELKGRNLISEGSL